MNHEEINERSYGVVPFMVIEKALYVFVIQHYSGAWLFPKGRAEVGETALQAAERELREETGLQIDRWLRNDSFTERYEFWRNRKKIFKEVQYFPALVSGAISLQQAEVKTGRWTLANHAASQVSFCETKNLLNQVLHWLQTAEPELVIIQPIKKASH